MIVINCDAYCSCGYNVRGLRSDGTCPECGRPTTGALAGLAERVAPIEPAQIALLKRRISVLRTLTLAVVGALVVGALLFEAVRSPLLGYLFLGVGAVALVVAAWTLKNLGQGIAPSVATYGLAVLVVIRVALAIAGPVALDHPAWRAATSIWLAIAASLAARRLGSIAETLRQDRHARTCRQMSLNVVGFSAMMAVLGLLGWPTSYAAHGLSFVANVFTLGSTMWLLSVVRKDLEQAVPESELSFLDP